jgi:hypothetical protein
MNVVLLQRYLTAAISEEDYREMRTSFWYLYNNAAEIPAGFQ